MSVFYVKIVMFIYMYKEETIIKSKEKNHEFNFVKYGLLKH